jgi:hypothetical protein
MTATEYLKKNKWRYYLKGRKRDFKHFSVPSANVQACQVEMNTKRNVRINLSTGEKMTGFMTISSGTELYFPKRFRTILRSAKWFECEIVGHKISDKATIDWM